MGLEGIELEKGLTEQQRNSHPFFLSRASSAKQHPEGSHFLQGDETQGSRVASTLGGKPQLFLLQSFQNNVSSKFF
jgi:hypothetical protein